MKPRAVAPSKANDLSPIVKFFLADDVRQEVDGKLSLMGLYADDVILVKRAPDEELPSESKPLAFDGLAFVFTISGILGEFEISAEIEGGPDATGQKKCVPILKPQKFPFPDKQKSANIVIKIKPFITSSLGVKTARLHIDGVVFQFPFEIRDGVITDTARAVI